MLLDLRDHHADAITARNRTRRAAGRHPDQQGQPQAALLAA
jgi:hypothetical protein